MSNDEKSDTYYCSNRKPDPRLNKCLNISEFIQAFGTYKNIMCEAVRTKGYSTDLLDPTQVESKKCSQIQWPVPSIKAEPVDIFLGEE